MNKRIISFGIIGVFALVAIILLVVWLCLPVTVLVGDEISSILSAGEPTGFSLFWKSFGVGNHLVYVSGDINNIEEVIKKYQPAKAVLAFTRMQIITTLKRASQDTQFLVVCYSKPATLDSADIIIYPDTEKIYQAFAKKVGKNTSYVIYDGIGEPGISQDLPDSEIYCQIVNDAAFFEDAEESRPVCVISTINTTQWPPCVRWVCDVSFYQMAVQGLKKNKEEQSCFLGILPTIKAIFF